MKIEEKLEKNLKKYHNKKFLLGISGGKDSMMLLHGMISLSDKYKFDIEVLHVNHGIRGDEALRDQELVRNYCNENNISFHLRSANMNSYAKEKKLSKEEAGRELRKIFFSEVKKEIKADYIVFAHHMDDQAETVLFRIMRGTGVKGLCGMHFEKEGILRPLLDIKRREIEEYIKEHNIPFGEDSTNLYNDYTRNKIRNLLIPYIDDKFDIDIASSLIRLSINSKELWEIAEEEIEEAYNNVIEGKDLLVEEFKSISRPRRLLLLHYLFEDYSLDRDTFIRMSEWIVNGRSGSVFQFTGGMIEKSFDKVRLYKRDEIKEFSIPFELNKEINIEGVGTISSSLAERDEIDYKDKNIIFIDLDKLIKPLIIRNRREGDKIAPFGIEGSKKIKEVLREERIPKYFRNNIAIIESAGEIIWIAGIRDSRKFKIEDSTTHILKLEYKEERFGRNKESYDTKRRDSGHCKENG